MNWEKRANQLVNEHWKYHDIMLPVFIADYDERQKIRDEWREWYKALALHFYKHAVEDIEAGVIQVNKESTE